MPTVTMNPPSEDEMKDSCRRLIHGMRAQLDPRTSSPEPLCARLKISRQYLSLFTVKGFVPMHIARRMNKIFGDDLAPVEKLSWSIIK